MESGLDVNVTNNENHMDLHQAAKEGKLKRVKALIKANTSLDMKNSQGQTALHVPIKCGKWHVADYLRSLMAKSAMPEDIDMDSNCLKFLMQNKKSTLALKQLERIDNKNRRRHMLETECDDKRNTLIHLASRNGWEKLVDTMLQCDLAEIDKKNKWGETALHSAASRQNLKCIKILLQIGAIVSCRDNDYNTPLHTAFKSHSPDPEVIRVLTDAYIEELRQRGESEVELPKNIDRNTPLHLAALYITLSDKNYCMQCINPLKIFDPTKKNDDDKTVFVLAAESKHFGMLEAMLSTFGENEDLEELLDNLLNICAVKGSCEMVAMLIELGADPKNGVLYGIITKSVEDDQMAESMIQVYRTIIESAHHWNRGKFQRTAKRNHSDDDIDDDDYHKLSVDDDVDDSYDYKTSENDIMNLVNKKHGGKAVTVLEHAVDEGAASMLKAIFLYKRIV